jgi:hypothetical protein
VVSAPFSFVVGQTETQFAEFFLEIQCNGATCDANFGDPAISNVMVKDSDGLTVSGLTFTR